MDIKRINISDNLNWKYGKSKIINEILLYNDINLISFLSKLYTNYINNKTNTNNSNKIYLKLNGNDICNLKNYLQIHNDINFADELIINHIILSLSESNAIYFIIKAGESNTHCNIAIIKISFVKFEIKNNKKINVINANIISNNNNYTINITILKTFLMSTYEIIWDGL